MAKILTVDVPNSMIRELEKIAKIESKRLGKVVTAEQLAEKAVRIYIRHEEKTERESEVKIVCERGDAY